MGNMWLLILFVVQKVIICDLNVRLQTDSKMFSKNVGTNIMRFCMLHGNIILLL